MLIFLHGADIFRTREKLEELKRRFLEKNKGNLFLISGIDTDNFNIAEFRNKVLSSGFFSNKKMIIFKMQDAECRMQNNELLEIIKKIPEETVLVIWEKSEDEKFLKSELGRYLLKVKYVFEFNLLQGAELANWIKERAIGYKCKIDSDAIADICDILGNDLQKVDLELNKICAYVDAQKLDCHAPGACLPADRLAMTNEGGAPLAPSLRGGAADEAIPRITRRIVGLFLSREAEDNIFKFLDALATKNKRLALLLLKEEFDAGVNELAILGSLARQARIMLWTKEVLQKNPNINQAGLAKELDIHSYAAGKALSQAKNFEAGEIKNLFRQLLQIDMAVKTGGVPARVLFDRMIAKI